MQLEEDLVPEIITFGKYNGRPLTELAADRPYVDWLVAQPWFRDRYENICNALLGYRNPQDTPEHNVFQAAFLNHDTCLRLCRLWLKDAAALRTQWLSYSERTDEQKLDIEFQLESHNPRVDFMRVEEEGWDVVLEAGTSIGVFSQSSSDAARSWIRICVELKPSLGDDYPSVLRTVIKRIQLSRVYRGYTPVVLVKHAEFAGVTFEDVQRMYWTQKITLLRTIDLPEIDDDWRCRCAECEG